MHTMHSFLFGTTAHTTIRGVNLLPPRIRAKIAESEKKAQNLADSRAPDGPVQESAKERKNRLARERRAAKKAPHG